VQCPWDAAAVGRTAAQNGDLPLLNWLSSEEANGRWKDGDGESHTRFVVLSIYKVCHVYMGYQVCIIVFNSV
jgi:beta-lactamase class D